MLSRNSGCDFDLSWINKIRINSSAIKNREQSLKYSRSIKNQYEIAWLLKAISCIDLTTLSGNDAYSNVAKLCEKASRPLSQNVVNGFGLDEPLRTAAVCVYPNRILDVLKSFEEIGVTGKINIASVAAGFPSGQMPLQSRLIEIERAVSDGATEIDVVIDRNLVLTGQWERLYDELKLMRAACGQAHLKTILATGELASLDNVYRASMVAMMAGSDFIKTSTGKETVNATIPVGIVMCRAIQDYHERTGYKIGLKPAGGIRTCSDALAWLVLVKEELGDEWLCPELFRIGASGLLDDIEKRIYYRVKGHYPEVWE